MSAYKNDTGKPKMHLIDPDFLFELAEVLTLGAEKYSDYNYREGLDYSRLYSAVQRHLNSWWDGQDIDPESDRSHLIHAVASLMMLNWMHRNRSDMDDRWSAPKRKTERPEKDLYTLDELYPPTRNSGPVPMCSTHKDCEFNK